VRVGNNTSATLTLNMGAPKGCMLNPLLYSLFTHDCVAAHDSNTYHTMVVGMITGSNETAFTEVWCKDNNLLLNISKTKELIVDYKERRAEHTPHLHRWGYSGPVRELPYPRWPHHYHGPNTPTQL
jgi:hypothetical protein